MSRLNVVGGWKGDVGDVTGGTPVEHGVLPPRACQRRPMPKVRRSWRSLTDALARCRGPEDTWMHRNLQRAIVLIGGLDEEDAVKILEQEGV